MSIFKEFREFISRGNVIDLAVGIVIGASFNAIVDALVKGILMPLVGLLTGGINFADKKIVIRPAEVVNGREIPENALYYGQVIQAIISFVIVALAVFLLIKAINRLRRLTEKQNQEAEAQTPPSPAPEVILLEEIRDLIKNFKN
ncbi:MAG: large-conductance mechanosensitive channel protein MscL [Flavobacteriales bacterium]|nr:large-conductance mechanosensitive channel protein MscL [Flavobacteriales bacterium]MDW8431710.1 large-conductance mechanosensitive channel protein MscL [Flavobacteriales bacterium]